MIKIIKFILFVLLTSQINSTPPRYPSPGYAVEVGQDYMLKKSYTSESTSTSGSTGSSGGSDVLIERVIAVTQNGVELEYTLPKSHRKTDEKLNWQFPARVFKPYQGQAKLLNVATINARLTRFLKHMKYSRESCGRWYFTWNAFKIECDPISVLEIVNSFDLGFCNYRAGKIFEYPSALKPNIKLSEGGETSVLTAQFALDPYALRRDAANTNVISSEINGQPISFDQALNDTKDTQFSGQARVTFDTDPKGCVTKRVVETTTETTEKDGTIDKQIYVETVERLALTKKPKGTNPKGAKPKPGYSASKP
jgi:hypothetical protein